MPAGAAGAVSGVPLAFQRLKLRAAAEALQGSEGGRPPSPSSCGSGPREREKGKGTAERAKAHGRREGGRGRECLTRAQNAAQPICGSLEMVYYK